MRYGSRAATAARHARAVEMAREGLTSKVIAERLGVSVASVQDACKRAGVQFASSRGLAQGLPE